MKPSVPRILRNRKGDGTALSTEQIIGLVLVAAVLLFLTFAIIGMLGIFTQAPDSGSLSSLSRVYDAVNQITAEDAEFQGCYLPNFFIEPDRVIVGFNADEEDNSHGSDGLTCAMGDYCVHDECGWWETDIKKPRSCGRGPCLCLCPTGYGDVNEESCMESSAVCRKYPQGVSFTNFRSVNSAGGEGCTAAAAFGGELCDAVMDSESCFWGVDMGVQYSLIIINDQGSRIIFDQVLPDQVAQRYANANHRCQETRIERSSEDESSKEGTTSKEASKEAKEASPTVDEALSSKGAGTPT